jgi:hypothetical protein
VSHKWGCATDEDTKQWIIPDYYTRTRKAYAATLCYTGDMNNSCRSLTWTVAKDGFVVISARRSKDAVDGYSVSGRVFPDVNTANNYDFTTNSGLFDVGVSYRYSVCGMSYTGMECGMIPVKAGNVVVLHTDQQGSSLYVRNGIDFIDPLITELNL